MSYESSGRVEYRYRPPRGNIRAFNDEVQIILNNLPEKNVHIMGDFNINLHALNERSEHEFEELIITSGYSPIISIATHEQPHCKKTCIDNILSNTFENLILTGVMADKIAHHRPVFQFTKANLPAHKEDKKVTIHYDYSNENMSKLYDELKLNINDTDSIDNFEVFFSIFRNSIDKTCKLKTPKTSKRNKIVNPWITQGLIKSVDKKHKLYEIWKTTKTNKNKLGDQGKFTEYNDHAKLLKHLIKKAKKII